MNEPRSGTGPDGTGASDPIARAVRAMGEGPLTEEKLRAHVFPLFSRVLSRGEIYLANHSLGRPPDRAGEDVARAMDAWYRDMDDAWGLWLDEIAFFRASVAGLLGLDRTDAVVPKTAAGQALRAVLNAIPKDTVRVVATRGEFDSIDFILKTYARRGRAGVEFVEPAGDLLFHAKDIREAVRRHSPDLLVVSRVCYATGQEIPELRELIAETHARGGLTLVDAYHAVGAMPVSMPALDADFMIGGSYKYTRGGPGACWLAVHPRHLSRGHSPALRTLDTGWFAKKDTFAFERPDEPLLSPGGDAWLESTPAVLPFFQARAGLELTIALRPDRLRAYNLEQQELLRSMLRARGVEVRDIRPRGAFLLLQSPDATAMVRALKARGVNTDSRLGHVRLCPDILNTREELARAAEIVADVAGGRRVSSRGDGQGSALDQPGEHGRPERDG